jgi:hypothetical protein
VLTHLASITVDAQGRITAASSGSAGGGAFVPVVLSNRGPSSGTYTATPGASQNFDICSFLLVVVAEAAMREVKVGVSGGKTGRWGAYTAPIAAPFSQPFSVG